MSLIESAVAALDPAAFIAGLIKEDIGVTQGRGMLREAGMRLGNDAFGKLYAQVRDTLGNRDEIQSLDYAAIPTGEQYSTWTAGEGGQYSTFVQTFVRPVGSTDPEPVYYFHLTDAPHSPNEAIQAAQSFIGEGGDAAPQYGPREIIGSVVTSVTRTVGRNG